MDHKRLPKSSLFQHKSGKKVTPSSEHSVREPSRDGPFLEIDFGVHFHHLLAPFFNIKNICWSLWLHFARFWLPFGVLLAPCWSISLHFDDLTPILRPTTLENKFLSIFLDCGLFFYGFRPICASIWTSVFNQICITFFDSMIESRNHTTQHTHIHTHP